MDFPLLHIQRDPSEAGPGLFQFPSAPTGPTCAESALRGVPGEQRRAQRVEVSAYRVEGAQSEGFLEDGAGLLIKKETRE